MKKHKIPRKYRKSLTEKQFTALQNKLVSEAEKKLLEKFYTADERGRRVLTLPEKTEELKQLSSALQMVHKTRRGVRAGRLILVAVIVLVPVVFALFFLDSLAASQTEKILEKLTRTDVTVEGMDVSLLKARVYLDRLAFADPADDMTDQWVLTNLDLDGSWRALIFRRFVVNNLQGTVAYRQPRNTPAVYPPRPEKKEALTGEKMQSMALKAFEWFPAEDLPVASLKVSENLRKESELLYREWEAAFRQEEKEINVLVERCRKFINKKQPDAQDIPGWVLYVKEGKDLLLDLNNKAGQVQSYESKINESLAFARRSMTDAEAALREDLKKIEDILALKPEVMNRWLQSALETYLGPRVSRIYTLVRETAAKARKKNNSPAKPGRGSGEGKRMKSGRIVSFPVILPPRFSISHLDLGGEGISVKGTHVGIDHHLAGFGSHLEFLLDGAAGVPGRIGGEILVDERECAESFVQGRVEAAGWSWALRPSDSADSVSGKMNVEAAFSVPSDDRESFQTQSSVFLENWQKGEGYFSFIDSSAPRLGFNCRVGMEDSVPEINVGIKREFIPSWLSFLTEAFLPAGAAQARDALKNNVQINLDEINGLMDSWDKGLGNLSSLDSSLEAVEKELQELLANSDAASHLPAGEIQSVIGGLKSLFKKP